MAEDPRHIWDSRYARYGKNRSNLQYDFWLEPLLPLLEKHARAWILDLGCGMGCDTEYLTSSGCRVVSADFSNNALKIVRERIPGAQVVNADIRSPLPFRATAFQSVVANLSLHYFPWQQTVAIIERIRGCLTPGGRLFARFNSVADPEYPENRRHKIDRHYCRVEGVTKRYFSGDDIQELFLNWEIERLEEREIHRYGFPKTLWQMAAVRRQSRKTIPLRMT